MFSLLYRGFLNYTLRNPGVSNEKAVMFAAFPGVSVRWVGCAAALSKICRARAFFHAGEYKDRLFHFCFSLTIINFMY